MANTGLEGSNGGTKSDTSMSDAQKIEMRMKIRQFSFNLLGVEYEYGAEWTNYAVIPSGIDCSELIEGCYKYFKMKMPDGSQNQYNFTIPTFKPMPADLAFFGRGGNPAKIYHVGMIYDDSMIIEARGYQPKSSFETGKVILRPKEKWEGYRNFVGYRSHPKLI